MSTNITIRQDDIRKAFVKKKGMKIDLITALDDEGRVVNDKNTVNRETLPHRSLKTAFQALLPHALNIARLVPKGSVFDEKYLKTRKVANDVDLRDFELVGIHISGKDDEPTVSFIIRKACFDGSTDIPVPAIKTHKNSTYPFSGMLVNDLDDAMGEVFEYINGKYVDSDQLTITEDEEEEEEDPFA